MKILSNQLRVFLLIMAALCTISQSVHAALVISGDASGTPGGSVSLSIELDASLVAVIDELTLDVQFDDAVLLGQNANAGGLLSGGLFAANAANGAATNSFLATLTEIGPGLIATWSFMIDPGAAAQSTDVQVTLRTLMLVDELTAELVSDPFSVSVVPVPPALLLLGSACGLLMARSRSSIFALRSTI